MIATRRNTFKLIGLALALGSLATTAHAHDDGDDDDGFRSGKVFTSTNAVTGNELLVYAADHGGRLTLQDRLCTQGHGTASGLGNQGAVTLSGNGRYLFVVNALGNSVSTFRIRRSGLTFESATAKGWCDRFIRSAGSPDPAQIDTSCRTPLACMSAPTARAMNSPRCITS